MHLGPPRSPSIVARFASAGDERLGDVVDELAALDLARARRRGRARTRGRATRTPRPRAARVHASERRATSQAAGAGRCPAPAASSSTATIAATLPAIGASRAAAPVAMLTWSSWFADVGSESTLRGCASDLFSEASAAAGDLRDHEARVDAAVLDERTAAAPTGSRPSATRCERSAIAPVSAMASGQVVGRERHAARRGSCRPTAPRPCREHQRVVGTALASVRQRRGDRARLVEHRAHHLRLAAQAVRILHARQSACDARNRAAASSRR
jgi:hypothetical protein